MAQVPVSIVYDELGNISSISQPTSIHTVIVPSGKGHSVLLAEVEEKSIPDMLATHRVNASQKTLIAS